MKKTVGIDIAYPATARVLLALGAALLLAAPQMTLADTASMQALPTELARLSITERESLDDVCLPIQFRDGASAYRECLQTHLERRITDVMSRFKTLSFDEKYAVQQACQSTHRSTEQTYHQCLTLQVQAAIQLPAPDLSGISEDERYVLQRSCFQAQTQSGARAYRQCLIDEIDNLQLLPRADLSTLTSLDRNAIQISCSPAHTTISAVEYRLCLNREIEASGLLRKAPAVSPATTSSQPAVATNAVTQKPVAVQRRPSMQVASADALGQSRAEDGHIIDANVSRADTSVLDSTTQDTTIQDAAIQARPDQSVPVSVAGTGSNKLFDEVIILKAAMATNDNPATAESGGHPQKIWLYAVPLLILLGAMHGLYLLLRRRPQQSTIDREVINPPIDFSPSASVDGEQFEPGNRAGYPQAPVDDGWDEFAEEHSQLDSAEQDFAPATDTDYTGSMEFDQTQVTGHPIVGSPSHEDHNVLDNDLPDSQRSTSAGYATTDDEMDQTLLIDTTGANAATNPNTPEVIPPMPSDTPIQPRSRFGMQLQASSSEARRALTTEFLLYWVSYCDGNISASRAERILQAQPRDEHDKIKQWVLEKDQDALTDALQYLRSESSDTIMQQTLLMMMCVLVDSRLTPLQNTFFRFFADLSGLGTDGLQRLYRSHFGRILPAMPRPDSVNWWRLHKDGTEAALSGTSGDLSAQQIQAQQELLNYRFDPAHFNQLGVKEQRLVQRHAEKRREALSAQGR